MNARERLASSGTRTPRWWPEWLRRRIEVNLWHQHEMLAAAQAATAAGARVLDAGAGEGRFRNYFAHARYVGVDVAVGDVTWDYSRLDALGDLTRLPFADASFDVVLCTEVLEHVSEPQQVVSEIARVLRPGGALYVAAPQMFHQHQKPYNFFNYTSFGLRHLLDRAGLAPVWIKPMGGYFWMLSFQLQALVYWAMPRPRRRWVRWLQYPLIAVLQAFCLVLLPLAFFYLDALDRQKDATLGWVLEARKPLPSTFPSLEGKGP
jgi:SAM-dependent methyltransferase